MATFPIVVGPAGLQPQTPAALRAQLIALVAAVRPGYTANLPGSLIEDISSTDTYALTMLDQALVELINSLTPLGANVFLLNQLGQMLGVPQGQATNTSVYVVFTGLAGYVIPVGFTVSDGTFQYTVQDGGVIAAGGISSPLFCLAALPGTWAIPTGIVTQIITSYPSSVTLTVTNPEPGTPGVGAETEESYRARVLQANLAESQGMAGYLKTQLTKVVGVQPRLVSVIQQTGGGWEVICGGGDPYEVAYAIYRGLFDISLLTGSILYVSNITNANPGVVTTVLNHNYSNGQIVNLVGVIGMDINNTALTITVVSPTSFSVGRSTVGLGSYVSGGIVSPNLRNISVSISDYPNSYVIPFVNPPLQSVGVIVTWNTTSANFVSSAGVAQLGKPAIVDYINNIPAGQPINLYEMQAVFAASVATVLPPSLLTTIVFLIMIDGITQTAPTGTGIIAGDPESYFQTQTSLVTINQGS